jgi:hypothetical protein
MSYNALSLIEAIILEWEPIIEDKILGLISGRVKPYCNTNLKISPENFTEQVITVSYIYIKFDF